MSVFGCSVSLCNCESAPPTLSLNLSTHLCIRWKLGLLGARWLLPEVVVYSETSIPMSTTSGHGVVHVSHVVKFSNFGGTGVIDNLRLGPSAGYGDLNFHDVDGNGCPDIEHVVKLMEAKLAERRGQLPEVMVF